MRFCIKAGLVAIILLVASLKIEAHRLDIGDHLDPEDAWSLYNYLKRPPSSGILLSGKELKMRKQIFIESYKKVQEHNKKYRRGKATWFAGTNKFTDYLPEELEMILGHIEPTEGFSLPHTRKNSLSTKETKVKSTKPSKRPTLMNEQIAKNMHKRKESSNASISVGAQLSKSF